MDHFEDCTYCRLPGTAPTQSIGNRKGVNRAAREYGGTDEDDPVALDAGENTKWSQLLALEAEHGLSGTRNVSRLCGRFYK